VPQPSVMMMSVHNIGMSSGKLRFGARQFLISQTFVAKQQALQFLEDPRMVFEGPQVVGLVSENLLFSIEDVRHQEVTNNPVAWLVTCNANTLR